MTFQAVHMEQTTLTLTQLALGSELLWEPKVGSPEHDRCVAAYIPGALTLQQKRAIICVDFFNTVEASTMPYPFIRTYHISIPVQASPASLVSHDSFSSVASSPASTAKPTRTKRAHDGASAPSKRLPGFSIMTRDGVDITENQSRGPKTKEQREHAAKMRKLGACPSCKRRKQKCEPSHHRVSGAASSAAATPMSSSMSARSSIPSLIAATPSTGSRASISPQSSLESAFTPPNTMATPAALSKQPQQQPWEEGLLLSELFDDELMLHGQYDTFAFGQNMFSQTASAGNWNFASPPMGQDFDLFSYDNTLDFDASLYVDSQSPLLQSSSQSSILSPKPLQQPLHAYSQTSRQSMDTSQQPSAFNAGGQYLGNVDGSAGNHGIAVDIWDIGEYDGLEPDGGRAACERQPQQQPLEGAKVLGRQGLQSRAVIAAAEKHIPQSSIDHNPIDPRTDLSLESIASSPESSVLSGLRNSPKDRSTSPYGPAAFSDVSQRSASGPQLGLREHHQEMATGLLTPPHSLRSSVGELLDEAFERPIGGFLQTRPQQSVERGGLAVMASSPAAFRESSLPHASLVSSPMDSFEESFSPHGDASYQRGPTWATIHDGIWVPTHDALDERIEVSATRLETSRPRASAIQRGDRLDTRPMQENTPPAFSVPSQSPSVVPTAQIPTRDQQTVLVSAPSSKSTTTPKAATTTARTLAAKQSSHGLVVSVSSVAGKALSATHVCSASILGTVAQAISGLLQTLSTGFRPGQQHAGVGSGRNGKVVNGDVEGEERAMGAMMAGLRLC